MARRSLTATPVEILKVRITHTRTGYPATLEEAQGIFGSRINPATDDGWYWIGATPASAQRIRRDGHKAVGEVLTVWMPPQQGVLVEDVDEPEGDFRPTYAPDGQTITGLVPAVVRA